MSKRSLELWSLASQLHQRPLHLLTSKSSHKHYVMFKRKFKLSHYLLNHMWLEGRSPQNISGASQQNSIAAFSWANEAEVGEKNVKRLHTAHPASLDKLMYKDVINTLIMWIGCALMILAQQLQRRFQRKQAVGCFTEKMMLLTDYNPTVYYNGSFVCFFLFFCKYHKDRECNPSAMTICQLRNRNYSNECSYLSTQRQSH